MRVSRSFPDSFIASAWLSATAGSECWHSYWTLKENASLAPSSQKLPLNCISWTYTPLFLHLLSVLSKWYVSIRFSTQRNQTSWNQPNNTSTRWSYGLCNLLHSSPLGCEGHTTLILPAPVHSEALESDLQQLACRTADHYTSLFYNSFRAHISAAIFTGITPC
jgi:hypothetical protein